MYHRAKYSARLRLLPKNNLVIKEAKLGANITGFTWWGLCDKNSWLKDRDTDATPLLCVESINEKKPAYYKVISTAYEHYWD